MKNNNKKLAQKGGMMIEALAMLGLIAVVTPTMYKKSAERTLEVEDINTATSMRSVMTAADSYVSSHYGEIVQAMTAGNQTTMPLSMTDLQQYLPYAFNADKLYDFKAPKVTVVRNGNNLTSFVLFPAKEDGENGLGQERTVRIATLVGANGGYVTDKNTAAKGIGGIWNLSNDGAVKFTDVFSGDDNEVYSIVTASSDAINNTNTEEDTDKFLYRTDGDGKWHNTMRSDLFLGTNSYDTNDVKENDGYYNNGTYSIRSVKSLIIGAENAAGGAEQTDYGLYVNNSGGTNNNAFIQGSLEAANSKFRVDENELVYNPGISLKANNSGLSLYSSSAYGPDDPSSGALHLAHQINEVGDITNYGDTVRLALGWGEGESGEFTVGAIGKGNTPAIRAEDDGSALSVALVGDDTFKISTANLNENNYNDKIVLMNNAAVRTQKGDSASWNKTVSYGTSPNFPVRVGSNMKVEGILATAQLDTQNIRTATLEAGSTNIDDANKWLTVDADGIHGEDPSSHSAHIEVQQNNIALATSMSALDSNYRNWSFKSTEANARNITNQGTYLGLNAGNLQLQSSANIDIYTPQGVANTQINVGNDSVQQQISGSDVVFSSLQAGTGTDPINTNVKVQKTNFEVQDTGSNLVFEVKGNTESNITKNNNDSYDVAMHGRTVFTSSVANPSTGRQAPNRIYMNVGDNFNSNAMVNIKQGTTIPAASDLVAGSVNANGKYKQVLTVDGDSASTGDVPSASIDSSRGGTVYVRKGMLEVNPVSASYFSENGGDPTKLTKTSADIGYGLVKASRFVANNPNVKGDATAPNRVPQFFTDTDYKSYNGVDNTNGRYDTYMVNPAYTSVMHDIKLTTRGGARLSDILPDFINKGIYITTNTYQDDIKTLQFKFDKTDGVKPVNGTAKTLQGSITLGAADSWASPYLGFVPAPQCPPGYNRLITMSPQSFMMAQAGQMQKGKVYARGGNGTNTIDAYYTKNQVPYDSAFEDYNQMILDANEHYVSQGFARVVGSADVGLSKAVTTPSGTSTDVKAKTSGLTLDTVDASGASVQQNPYFLVSYGDTTPPLTIQQSTWLKTNVVPVGSDTSKTYGIGTSVENDYVRGWAALMGFVYDKATYQTVINNLGSNLITYDGSGDSVYWNVFPVRRNTLEAYATTYCYFDRNGIMWNELKNGAYGQYIDHYNAVNDYKQYDGEKKNSSDAYRKRLNDPTLKYDEVW